VRGDIFLQGRRADCSHAAERGQPAPNMNGKPGESILLCFQDGSKLKDNNQVKWNSIAATQLFLSLCQTPRFRFSAAWRHTITAPKLAAL